MVITLIVAIVVGLTMPFPINIIQPVLCGLSLAARVPRMIQRGRELEIEDSTEDWSI